MTSTEKFSINYLLNNEVPQKPSTQRTTEDMDAASHLFLFQQVNSMPADSETGKNVIQSTTKVPSSESNQPQRKHKRTMHGTASSGVCYPPKKISQLTPYQNEGDVFLALRVQAYCNLLRNSTKDSEQRFACPFDPSCEKRVKGKGNLRRHIEWHLQKLEGDYRDTMGAKWGNGSSVSKGVKSEWQLIKDVLPSKFHC